MENFEKMVFRNKDSFIDLCAETVEKDLDNFSSTCYILPTGIGKTMILTRILKSKYKDKKILYLSPNEYINQQTANRFIENGLTVDVSNYPMMHSYIRKAKLGLFEDYDLIIIDEFHRLGSKMWGNSWLTIANNIKKKNLNTKILGMTATEKRYLDNCRDMAAELFENISICITLPKIWDMKIMTAPCYIVATELDEALGDLDSKLNSVDHNLYDKDDINNVEEKIRTLRANWFETQGISGILKKHLPKDCKRLLVFHESIDSTGQTIKLLEKYLMDAGFKDLRFYICNSGVNDGSIFTSSDTSIEELNKFNNKNDGYKGLKVMLSVNMLSEGLHVEDCHAEIMFRTTFSKNVFLQQIGRVMSISSEKRPIIFDFVQNLYVNDVDNIYTYIFDNDQRKAKHTFDMDSDGVPDESLLDKNIPIVIDETVEFRLLKKFFDSTFVDSQGKLLEFYEKTMKGDYSWIIPPIK